MKDILVAGVELEGKEDGSRLSESGSVAIVLAAEVGRDLASSITMSSSVPPTSSILLLCPATGLMSCLI